MKRTLEKVWSPHRRNRRDVDVYLPHSYGSKSTRYPVVYMHDGQNLSDPSTAFAGTWDLDATLERLAEHGIEPIVVGVHNAREERLTEYSPFRDPRHGGGEADAYLAFLAETVKPRVDRLFRTQPHRDATVILGSSMGGLVSLYAYFRYPWMFGRAGAMSPSLWFGRGALFDFIEEARTPDGRLYLDVGTHEGAATLRDARTLGRLLVKKKGFARDRRSRRRQTLYDGPNRRTQSGGAARLRYVEDPAGGHNEASWAGRLSGALAFLLG